MNAYEFLLKKGINKVHQPKRKYNLSVTELIQFLEEYSREKKIIPVRPITKAGNKHK